MSIRLGVAGTQVGQRALNGPQTTGREYRNLSAVAFAVDDVRANVHVPMHDGVDLLVDVYVPRGAEPVPALFAASPYPRQMQNSGVPMGFVEAGATDFFVPRGYAHVIANVRGTGGSGGEYDLFGPTERRDMAGLVEWIAAQPWCNGVVGGIGISAFAMTQFEAAVEKSPHLRALFAPLLTIDLYQAFYHGGVLSSSFGISWLRAVAKLANVPDAVFRGKLATIVETILRSPRVHKRFEHFNGEAALGAFKMVVSGDVPEPFATLLADVTIDHQVKDEFWQSRDLRSLLEGIEIPVYFGSDWSNVPMHLPSTFSAFNGVASESKRLSLLPDGSMTWPWESLHVEALAWFDHWLKGSDTGIMDGPVVRYVIPGEPGTPWHEAQSWPPPGCAQRTFALRADGSLSPDEGAPGSTAYVHRSQAYAAVPTVEPEMAVWTSPPLDAGLRFVGPAELLLDAASTGGDTAFLVMVQDVAPNGNAMTITASARRAAIDDGFTMLGAVGSDELHRYRIPLVDNARCFAAGHAIRLIVRSDERSEPEPMLGFHHAPIGAATRITVASSSRLSLSVLAETVAP